MNSDHRPPTPMDNQNGRSSDNPLDYPSQKVILEHSIDGLGKPKRRSFYDQAYDYGIEGGRWKRAYARLIHLLPKASPIDIYLDGRLFYSGLSYHGISDYISVRPGNHRIFLYTVGRRARPIFYKTLFIPRRGVVSMVIHGKSEPDVMVLDDRTIIPPGRAKVKIVHLAPHLSAVDLLANGSVWFNEIIYQEASEYISITAGREALVLRASETKHIIFSLPNAHFGRNKAYTVYVTGSVNVASSLKMIVTQDNSACFNY